MLEFNNAVPRDVLSLKNWVEGNPDLQRDETAYLDRNTDLISVATVEDNALNRLEALLERSMVQHYKGFRKVRNPLSSSLSRDQLSPTF